MIPLNASDPKAKLSSSSLSGIQQLFKRVRHTKGFLNVSAGGVRICGIEEVRLNHGIEDKLDKSRVPQSLVALPDASKDLIEPRGNLSNEVRDVRFEITIKDDGEQNPGVVIEKEDPEVVYRADSVFPICRLGLELRQAFAEDAGTVRGHFADSGQFPSLADPSAWAVGLTRHHLCYRRALIFHYLRSHGSAPSWMKDCFCFSTFDRLTADIVDARPQSLVGAWSI